MSEPKRETENTAEKPAEVEGPMPGTWAYTARMMALTSDPDDDFDWDAWKDEMKEGCL